MKRRHPEQHLEVQGWKFAGMTHNIFARCESCDTLENGMYFKTHVVGGITMTSVRCEKCVGILEK